MYKKCAQAAENLLENPVQRYPQNPRLAVARKVTRNVIRTIHSFAKANPLVRPQLVHTKNARFNRSEWLVFRSFHTTYYYYY